MNRIFALIEEDREFSASIEAVCRLRKSDSPLPIAVNGLAGGATIAYVTEAARKLSGDAPVLVIVSGEEDRDKLCDALNSAGLRAYAYKKREFIFHNISASHDNERERLEVLMALSGGNADVIVTTPDAAVGATIPHGILSSLVITLKVGTEISPEELCEKLVALGFARSELVESAGQFARRGGIVDFHINGNDNPIRVEFFGDEIDRMVSFDAITQRSFETLGEVKLVPALEVMVNPSSAERIKRVLEKLISATESENTRASLMRELAHIDAGRILDSRDRFLGLIYGKTVSLLDYCRDLSVGAALVIGTAECEAVLNRYTEAISNTAAELLSGGYVTKECIAYCHNADKYKKFLSEFPTVHINSFAGTSGLGELGGIFGFRCKRTVAYGDNPLMLKEDIAAYVKGGYRVVIQCENRMGAESLSAMLREEGYTPRIADKKDALSLESGSITVCVGELEGFELIMPRVAVLSMAKDKGRAVMQRKRQQRILRRSGGAGQRIMSYADLEVGDYVVHANYGIGLFEGMESIRIDGITKDYITIKYAGTDKLFVPCDRLEMIGKYMGSRAEDGTVKLSKMGGTEWHKAKSRAKSSVRDIAGKLIKLYAERQRTPGFAFPRDSELEDEFAADFEFEETESQLAAIEDIKSDMQAPVPMNRLLCGDVGFGKTEVALRAAFKAIMGGKQVAILVPTTILALQHYQTVVTRMRGYPVTVDMLSRFRTPKEQARILDGLKAGKIDIVIGTHKLLGKKAEFKDLGLLIIDEEQRFGVAQKERLKEQFAGVDVLTLSATPIPRTLNMAINGISDMSVLDEAPENRHPVQTYVLEHDELVIYDAIRRELSRGGQVLYLYNNIETIDYVAGKIMTEIPEARVAYAHGRMEKDELEDIWQSLVSAEIDVLVCTTIIETGIDLPSANTLIIENADRMGLSQLHQIRGRVGRSERQAYAYFTYRPGKALSDVAKKRLAAIHQYAEFGAGFKIALCDLEIRGAGNLLGAEQHGYIDSVGYDLYVKLLSEAVLEERGVERSAEFESNIDFKVDAHIPEYYISRSAFRMEIYKKISHIRTPMDKDDIYDELTDRFGEVPRQVDRLLKIAFSRAVAEAARIPRVELRGSSILFYTDKPDLGVWSMILARHTGQLMGASGPAPIIYKLRSGEDPVGALCNIFTEYYAELNSKK